MLSSVFHDNRGNESTGPNAVRRWISPLHQILLVLFTLTLPLMRSSRYRLMAHRLMATGGDSTLLSWGLAKYRRHGSMMWAYLH